MEDGDVNILLVHFFFNLFKQIPFWENLKLKLRFLLIAFKIFYIILQFIQ